MPQARMRGRVGDVRELTTSLTSRCPCDRLDKGGGGRHAPARDALDSPRTVFVSYAAAAAALGNAIRQELSERGFDAMTADDVLEVSSSWQASMLSAID
jgi:hypothetical protein